MSSRYRSRRRRRPVIPTLLLLAGLAAIVLLLFRFLGKSSDTPSDPHPTSSSQTGPSSAPSQDTPEPPPTLPPLSDAPWELTLVNKDHPLPDNWTIETTQLTNGLLIDRRIFDALTAMLNDCKAEGLSPIVCSAYRTIERQTELFENKIDAFMQDGLSYNEAYLAASQVVAIPGTSEHNLGLSVDICALDYQLLNDAQAETAEQIWLMEHCAEYGFILRYPKGKEDITGIIWEPWHYRYVGVELAEKISASGLCLEEYLALYYSGV